MSLLGLQPAFCFPSVSLYITCCPNLEVTTPELAGCPVEFQDLTQQCCTEDATQQFLTLADLPPENEDHEEAMNLLWYFLRDIDVLSLDAWRLLVKGTAQAANLKMFDFKSSLSLSLQTLDVRETAVELSRLMVKTMHRIEGFQQFCIWHLAAATGRMVTEVSPDSCEMLEIRLQYKAAAANHDFLMYWLIPQISQKKSELAIDPSPSQEITVALQVVCVGPWAERGVVTLRSLLQHRSFARLRIFVLSDSEGWRDWLRVWKNERGEDLLQGVSFERVDFANLEPFQWYMMKRYPTCRFHHEIELAMLARVLCHELLPDVDWVISMDLGDVLVMDDISELWNLRHQLMQHFLGISYAAALGQHLNAGLVLYNLQQMRRGNFTELTLRAARWSTEQGDGTCPRDQNILNLLNDEEFLDGLSILSVEKAKILRILPCRWSLFPAVDWHPAWSKPELWHTELFHRLRYPGLVSSSQVELYCPDSVDLLMAFAFLPISSRQGRVRIYAEQEGGGHLRHCHPLRIGQPCCACGEAAALLHVAGDLKQWPAMRNFLDQGRLEREDVASERWWGGDSRQRRLKDQSAEQMFLMAKDKGLDLVIPLAETTLCRTMRTEASARDSGLGELWSEELEVQTTAEEFRFRLTSNSSLEVTMEAQLVQVRHEGAIMQNLQCTSRPTWISLRFLGFGTQPLQLEVCGDKIELPGVAMGNYSLQVASLQEAFWAICVT